MEITNQSEIKEPQVITYAGRSLEYFLWRALNLALLISIAIIILVPFVWLVTSSLKTQLEIFQYPPSFLPNPAQWNNFTEALTLKPFDRYLRNTLIIAVVNVIAVVGSSSLCAYGFARIQFPGRDFWFGIVMATLFLPYARFFLSWVG
jgi:multiple sugar transport system permease protein